MPTIDQLPAASASADTDELVVSQGGITRKLTRAQLLSGVQFVFTAGADELLAGTGTGVVIGDNLVLTNGTLEATGTTFVISQLSTVAAVNSPDLVPISQGGSQVAISYATFMSDIASLQGINASRMQVTPTGSTAILRLSDLAANAVQRTGAQMTGPLLLATDPALPLQAATMAYVQNTASAAAALSLPLAGGTMTGAIAAQGGITQMSTSAGTAFTPIVTVYSPNADRGPTGFLGFSAQVTEGTLSQNPDGSGNRFDTEFLSVQLGIQTTDGGTIGHSAVGTHVTKTLPLYASGAGYTLKPGDRLPACWSLYGTAADESNLPTSIAGPLACQEYDMQVNAIDDAGVRGGYTFNADNKVQVSAGGLPTSVTHAFYSTGLNDAWIGYAFRASGNHALSAYDCRAINGPETTVASNSTGKAVHVANVTPFTIGTSFVGQGTSSTNPVTNVQIGANVYQVSGYTLDGGGQRSGTLNLTTALQGADGNAGQRVARPFYALVMRTGDKIGFDTNGNVLLYYDSTIFGGGGGLHTNANLQCAELLANGVVSTGNSAFTNVVASNGLNVTGGFLQPSSFTFANLPNPGLAPANALVWVANGLKPGESAGAGTGVLACRNGSSSAWLRVGDYTTVAA